MRTVTGTRRAAPRGMTLIEVVIAVVVLSIGILAAWRTIDQARRGIGGQEARVLAETVALNRVAELQVLGMAAGRSLPARVAMGRQEWQVEVVESETRIGLIEAQVQVSAPGRPGARLVAHVPVAAPVRVDAP